MKEFTITLVLTRDELQNLLEAVQECDQAKANLLGGIYDERQSPERESLQSKVEAAIVAFDLPDDREAWQK